MWSALLSNNCIRDRTQRKEKTKHLPLGCFRKVIRGDRAHQHSRQPQRSAIVINASTTIRKFLLKRINASPSNYGDARYQFTEEFRIQEREWILCDRMENRG